MWPILTHAPSATSTPVQWEDVAVAVLFVPELGVGYAALDVALEGEGAWAEDRGAHRGALSPH